MGELGSIGKHQQLNKRRSSDNTRKVVLYDSIGTNVGESTIDGKTIAAYEFDLTEAGTYYIGCEVNGINIYYIEVVDTVTK